MIEVENRGERVSYNIHNINRVCFKFNCTANVRKDINSVEENPFWNVDVYNRRHGRRSSSSLSSLL